ncbi:hypothetical protein B7463_g10814, partial [Scytalidium lignicola]
MPMKNSLVAAIFGYKRLATSKATKTSLEGKPICLSNNLKLKANDVCIRKSNNKSKTDDGMHITAVVTNKTKTKVQTIHLPMPKNK